MRIFVDTNVYINFIRTSDEKLKSLDELEKLVKGKNVSLIFPKITLEELIRNMPQEVIAYQKNIEQQLPKQPAFAVSIDKKRREKIDKIHKEYKEELKSLRAHYIKSVKNVEKKIVEDLWNLAIKLEDNPGLVEKAHARQMKGNPPGKGNHIGDQLEWELLLENCLDDDLTIVTFDGDWFNLLDQKRTEIHPLLSREWLEKTQGKKKIQIFTTVGEAINKLAGKVLISKKEIEEEKKGSVVSPLFIHVNDGIRVSASPSASLSPSNLGTIGLGSAASLSASASISPSQWQPVTVVGTIPGGYLQCYSCGRIVLQSEYYGFTAKGYGCKYCLGG